MALQASCSSSPGILLKVSLYHHQHCHHHQFSPLLSIRCISPNPFPSPNHRGCRSVIRPIKLQHRVLRALADNSCIASNDLEEEDLMSSEPLDHGVTEGDSEKMNQESEHGAIDENEMIRVCDRLIEVFLVDKPTPADWRKLLVFSKKWGNIRSHFFSRCKDRADAVDDPGVKHKLLRLGRKLKEIDEDVQRHNELLEVVCGAPSEIHEIVSRRRKDFTKEFFEHVRNVAEAYYDSPDYQNAIANLGKKCLAAIQAYDNVSGSMESLKSIELQLRDVMNSSKPDVAGRKIDFLAEKNRMDSAAMQIATKAWASTRETPITKDEAKDVMFHLYKEGLVSMERQLPKEIRILKYLLSINDPEEKLSGLRDAFTPGEETEGEEVDMLYTTPEKLYAWIKTVLDVYYLSPEASRGREVRDLMNPLTVQKLKEMKKLVEDNFL